MAMNVYTYVCVNPSCRYIEKYSGMMKAQKKCPKCDHQMNLVKTEREK